MLLLAKPICLCCNLLDECRERIRRSPLVLDSMLLKIYFCIHTYIYYSIYLFWIKVPTCSKPNAKSVPTNEDDDECATFYWHNRKSEKCYGTQGAFCCGLAWWFLCRGFSLCSCASVATRLSQANWKGHGARRVLKISFSTWKQERHREREKEILCAAPHLRI